MGDYQGRRRGRPAPEPYSAPDPVPDPNPDPAPDQDPGYFADAAFGGMNYRDAYVPPPEYHEPEEDSRGYVPRRRAADSYDERGEYGAAPHQGYEAYEPEPEPGYRGARGRSAELEAPHEPEPESGYRSARGRSAELEAPYEPEQESGYRSARGRNAELEAPYEPEPESGYRSARGRAADYESYEQEPFEPYEPVPAYPYRGSRGRASEPQPDPEPADRFHDYAEPRFESPHRAHRARLAAPDTTQERPPRDRAPRDPRSHLPYTAAATVALIAVSFISAKAIAVVVLPLQAVVAWAVLDLLDAATRRAAIVAALPAVAATVGTFAFPADTAASAIAAGLGCGFVLVAADSVLAARRRGVEPGAGTALAANTSALLFACLTGMFVPAARMDPVSVTIGAVIGGALSLVAVRSPDLAASRAAVVAVPATAAALASYAAAILVA